SCGFGARGRIRTDDLPITSRMRYHYATRAGGAAERVGGEGGGTEGGWGGGAAERVGVEAECTEGGRGGARVMGGQWVGWRAWRRRRAPARTRAAAMAGKGGAGGGLLGGGAGPGGGGGLWWMGAA